ncbi:DUF309 domain-containing protein [Deinococcus sp. Arct2-2]|uniref:DUF309 domain-containing protein n=1 Tax=Deinococcus sp. Arct2-2 TaxID=2568653 RepID=UPI0010A38BD1|nr:DUF309 domain-containing protein [Deinococcus sp. Arct2-2]THF71041.1 DUF309 domain-containing protein [Deinococcus sp. Arct2-2]
MVGADALVSDSAAWQDGIRLFNSGHWWEAHEAWEGAWLRAAGDERACLSALILLAAALHKRWHHGSLAHRNFTKSEKYLDALPAEFAGIRLAALRADVWSALQADTLEQARPQVQYTAH